MVLGRLDRGDRGLGLHVGALALAPLSIVQAVLSGGLVFLAVFAERFFGSLLLSPPAPFSDRTTAT